jgi:hypothetical protein
LPVDLRPAVSSERRPSVAEAERKSFDSPDEVREFPYGRAEIVKIGGGEVGRLAHRAGLALVGAHQAESRD